MKTEIKPLALKKGETVAVMVIDDQHNVAHLNKWKLFKVSHVSENYMFSISGHGRKNLIFFQQDHTSQGFFQVLHMQFYIKPLRKFAFWNRINLILTDIFT